MQQHVLVLCARRARFADRLIEQHPLTGATAGRHRVRVAAEVDEQRAAVRQHCVVATIESHCGALARDECSAFGARRSEHGPRQTFDACDRHEH
jgi:hypothetical protein